MKNAERNERRRGEAGGVECDKKARRTGGTDVKLTRVEGLV